MDYEHRYKILCGRVAERARDLLRQICQAREVVIIRGAVSPDHIHMLVSCPPNMAPAKLVQYLKGDPPAVCQTNLATCGSGIGDNTCGTGILLRECGRVGQPAAAQRPFVLLACRAQVADALEVAECARPYYTRPLKDLDRTSSIDLRWLGRRFALTRPPFANQTGSQIAWPLALSWCWWVSGGTFLTGMYLGKARVRAPYGAGGSLIVVIV